MTHTFTLVLFLISSHTTIAVYEKFIRHIMKTTGPIATNIFMAAMDDNFYKAWIKATGDTKRVCVWHVHKAWNTNKSKMDDPKALEVLKQLKQLTYITDELHFRKSFTNLPITLARQKKTKPFAEYLIKYYGYEGTHPPQQWASCYVENGGPKTNMALENFHKHFKTNIIGQYINIRIDKLVHHLRRHINDTAGRLLIKSDRQPYSHRRN